MAASNGGGRVVLREEEYLARLSAIVRRDYFPSLDRLAAQRDYLAAMEGADVEALRLAAYRLDVLDDAQDAAPPPGAMAAFQRTHVTEDAHSFEALLERTNAERSSRFERIFAGPPALRAPLAERLLCGPSQADPHLQRDAAAPPTGRRAAHVAFENATMERRREEAAATDAIERLDGSGTLVTRSDLSFHFWKIAHEHSARQCAPARRPAPSVARVRMPMHAVLAEAPASAAPSHAAPLLGEEGDGEPKRPSMHTFRMAPTPRREGIRHGIAASAAAAAHKQASRRPPSSVASGTGIRTPAPSSACSRRARLLQSPAVRRLIRGRLAAAEKGAPSTARRAAPRL